MVFVRRCHWLALIVCAAAAQPFGLFALRSSHKALWLPSLAARCTRVHRRHLHLLHAYLELHYGLWGLTPLAYKSQLVAVCLDCFTRLTRVGGENYVVCMSRESRHANVSCVSCVLYWRKEHVQSLETWVREIYSSETQQDSFVFHTKWFLVQFWLWKE